MSIIPKPECFGDFGEDSLTKPPFWGDLGGLVVIICPDISCVDSLCKEMLHEYWILVGSPAGLLWVEFGTCRGGGIDPQ